MAVLPDFEAAQFVPGAPIDHTFFPLTPGVILKYRTDPQVDPDTGEVTIERNDLFTTFETFEVMGVETTVIHDTVYENEVMKEDTLDWYAQDTDGNLWYFGEIVINYEYDEDGNFIGTNHDGQWTAGVDGALPGWLMPADPGFGPAFYLEYAPGIAEDESVVIGVDETVVVDGQTYEGVVKILDTSRLLPEGAEFKYYAPGLGEVIEQAMDHDGTVTGVTKFRGARDVGDEAGNDANDLEIPLGRLSEGKALAGAARAEEPDVLDFAGSGADFTVTLLKEMTDANNSLGAYSFDIATGEIGEARILFTDTENAVAGENIAVHVESGKALGLFLVSNGGDHAVDLSAFEAGGLFFRNMLTGEAARIGDGLSPVATDADGNLLPIQPLNFFGSDDGFNFLNPAAGLHAVELNSKVVDDRPDEVTLLGFEDRLTTNPTHDGDFNDLVVAVSDGALADDTVRDLLGELDGGGTPEDDLLLGTAGQDVLRGLAGNDTVKGRGGDDLLEGGKGSDVLFGGLGDDDLRGGGGADVFKFVGRGFGQDEIFDFRHGQGDLIRLDNVRGAGGGIIDSFADLDSDGDGRLTQADDAVDSRDGGLVLAFANDAEVFLANVSALVEGDLLIA
jgi:Ca2+-binding RTX toxin-like protein